MTSDLEITRLEYIDILRNTGKHISSEIDDDTLLEKVKYLKKRDLIHLATIRGIVSNDTSLENILDVLSKDVHKKKLNNLKAELYRNVQKRKNNQIINELKKTRRIKNSNLVKKENISQKELNEVKKLSDLPIKILRKLAQVGNIETTDLKKSELLYILMRTQKHHKEKEYLRLLQADSVNEIKSKTNEIRKVIIEMDMLLNKIDRDITRKRLEKIDKETHNRTQKRRLLEELNNILLDLEFKKKHINNAFDSSSYYGLKDLEYTFGDLDDYYMSILSKGFSGDNYQVYTCRGDKNKDMYITNYLEKVKPYLIALIDKKKISNQKIQLDIAVNLIHLSKSDRITFYVKSKNIECYPFDNSEDILNQLFDSLLKYFNDKLLICRTDSSYVFESVEGLSIHFHKIDLKRGSSYIPTQKWLEIKKATINPKNKNDNCCFVYATTIALYHNEIGNHPERISNKL